MALLNGEGASRHIAVLYSHAEGHFEWISGKHQTRPNFASIPSTPALPDGRISSHFFLVVPLIFRWYLCTFRVVRAVCIQEIARRVILADLPCGLAGGSNCTTLFDPACLPADPDPHEWPAIFCGSIQVCTRFDFGTRVAFAIYFMRSCLQFLAVRLISEPILLSRFEFCMHSLLI